MLREFLDSLTTSCGASARKLGLMYSSIALGARHRRCHQAWAPHLARCRDLIARAASDCPGRDLAVVVGSGYLLDIPLDVLAEGFRLVVLADVVHPRPARRAASKLPNVSLLEFDVTGLHQAVARICRDRVRVPLPRPEPPRLPGPRPDFLVSANLLSQIGLGPVDCLRKDVLHVEKEDLQALARGIVTAHLDWLRSAAERVCLISDYRREVRRDGEVLEQVDLLHGETLPPGEDWEWLLAPRPEARPDADVFHLVRGVADLRKVLHGVV